MEEKISINWSRVPISPDEFSEDPIKYADPQFIIALQDFRILYGKPYYPSPVSGALARFDGSKTSKHYVGDKDKIERRSNANDGFWEGLPIDVYHTAITCGLFGGIGVYFDGFYSRKSWPRFHFDTRKNGFKSMPLIWFVKNNKYYYPQYDIDAWLLLKDRILYSPCFK